MRERDLNKVIGLPKPRIKIRDLLAVNKREIRMGYLSHRVDRSEIKPGDHIYTWRPAFTYAHHGIYVGENKVIHFTSDHENAKLNSAWNLSSSLPVPSSCLNSIDESGYSLLKNGDYCDSDSCICTYSCGFHQSESGVTISCLNCFIGTGSLYLYQYGVNKWTLLSKLRGGICTVAPSDQPEDVINRAIYLLGEQKGFGDYNVGRNNCEDFALYCKTGLLIYGKGATGGSGQVNFLVNASRMLHLPVALKNCNNVMGSLTAAHTVVTYYWDRYKTDIGVRDDVVKVRVEDVESFKSVWR